MQRYGLIGVSAVMGLVVLVVCVLNGASAAVNLFGQSVTAPLGVFLFATFALGYFSSLSLWSIKMSKSRISDVKMVQWEKQDEKLEKEIRSDREKQLEAKIETLETALRAALQKKK